MFRPLRAGSKNPALPCIERNAKEIKSLNGGEVCAIQTFFFMESILRAVGFNDMNHMVLPDNCAGGRDVG